MTDRSSSPTESFERKRKVARRACLACREKKIKCDGEQRLGKDQQGSGVCSNCALSGTQCVFVASMRGGKRIPNRKRHLDTPEPAKRGRDPHAAPAQLATPTLQPQRAPGSRDPLSPADPAQLRSSAAAAGALPPLFDLYHQQPPPPPPPPHHAGAPGGDRPDRHEFVHLPNPHSGPRYDVRSVSPGGAAAERLSSALSSGFPSAGLGPGPGPAAGCDPMGRVPSGLAGSHATAPSYATAPPRMGGPHGGAPHGPPRGPPAESVHELSHGQSPQYPMYGPGYGPEYGPWGPHHGPRRGHHHWRPHHGPHRGPHCGPHHGPHQSPPLYTPYGQPAWNAGCPPADSFYGPYAGSAYGPGYEFGDYRAHPKSFSRRHYRPPPHTWFPGAGWHEPRDSMGPEYWRGETFGSESFGDEPDVTSLSSSTTSMHNGNFSGSGSGNGSGNVDVDGIPNANANVSASGFSQLSNTAPSETARPRGGSDLGDLGPPALDLDDRVRAVKSAESAAVAHAASQPSSFNRPCTPVSNIADSVQKRARPSPTGYRVCQDISNNELVAHGLPIWSVASVLFDLYFSFIQPQFKLLEPKDKVVGLFTPRRNTALVHAMFLCARPYLAPTVTSPIDNQYNYSANYYLEKIEKYMDELETLEMLQTLLLLSYYYTKFDFNKQLAEANLSKALSLIHDSGMVLPFQGASFPRFMKNASKNSKAQKETTLRAYWAVYLLIQGARVCFDDDQLCVDILAGLDISTHNVRSELLPENLPLLFPYGAFDTNNSDPNGKARTFYATITIQQILQNFTSKYAHPGAYVITAAKIYDDMKANLNEDNFILQQVEFERVLNSKLYSLEDNGKFMVLNSSALHAKIIALIADYEFLVLESRGMPHRSLFDITRDTLCSSHLEKINLAITFQITKWNRCAHYKHFRLLLVILDFCALLNLATGTTGYRSDNKKDASLVAIGPSVTTPCLDICSEDYIHNSHSYEDWVRDVGDRKKKAFMALSNDCPNEQVLEERRAEFKREQTRLLWFQFPSLLFKMACSALPLLGYYTVLFRSLRPATIKGQKKLFYQNSQELHWPNDIWSSPEIRQQYSKTIEWAEMASVDVTDDEIWEVAVSCCDESFLARRFYCCAEFLKQNAQLVKDGAKIQRNVDYFCKFIERG